MNENQSGMSAPQTEAVSENIGGLSSEESLSCANTSSHYSGHVVIEPVMARTSCECEDDGCEEELAPQNPQNFIKNSFREFKVKPLNYGYIITSGCHDFAVETPARLIQVLTDYINDPDGKEKQWWSNKTI